MEEKKENSTCINCGETLNHGTSIDGAPFIHPRPNDLAICLICGHPYYFGEQLEFIPITQEQYRAMPAHARQQLKDAWNIRKELLLTALRQASNYDN